MLVYVFLVIGFVFLIKGADFFVEGSSSVAKIFKVPSIIIGLTIVAMGTSTPEMAVSISAGLVGKNALAVSNVIGSNIFNLLVIGGLCAIIHGMKVDKDILKRDFPFAIGAGILLLLMTIDLFFKGGIGSGTFDLSGAQEIGVISRVDGLILIVLFIIYMVMLIRSALKGRKDAMIENFEGEEEEYKVLSLPKSILYIIGGAAVIIAGGQLVVNSASAIAASFGMTDTLIGLTVCAIGTSLPELVTSIAAMKKGEDELALGNIVGSCIFNVLFVLALSAVLTPITVAMADMYDLAFLAIASLFMYLCSVTKKYVNRMEGIIIFVLYILYMIYVIIR